PLVATAAFGYVRLRRGEYEPGDLANWAARLRAVDGWRRVYVFLKHDEGRAPALARGFVAGLAEGPGGNRGRRTARHGGSHGPLSLRAARTVRSGEPRRISMCHCLECQRRTGSAFRDRHGWIVLPEDMAMFGSSPPERGVR